MVSFADSHFAKSAIVGGAHIRKTRAESLIVRTGKRVGSLQIDVILDHDKRSLREFALDAARCVGEDHGFYAHASKNANGKCHLLHGIALVEMDTSLHSANGNFSNFADDKFTGVANGRGSRKIRNLPVRNFCCAGKFIRESAEARAEDQSNFRLQRGSRGKEIGREPGAFEFAERLAG